MKPRPASFIPAAVVLVAGLAALWLTPSSDDDERGLPAARPTTTAPGAASVPDTTSPEPSVPADEPAPVVVPATAVSPPDSIPADCSTDVTDSLNAWLASLPEAAVVDLTGRCYHTESTVYLDRPVTIVGGELRQLTDGRGTPVGAHSDAATWPRRRIHVLVRASNVSINQLTIRGANAEAVHDTDLEAQHAVSISGDRDTPVHDVTVTGMTIRDVYGDGISVTNASSSVTIRGNDIAGIGRQGIAVTWATDVLVEDNTIDRVARSAIDIEPLCSGPGDSVCWEVRRVTIRGNRFSNITNFIIANLGASPEVSEIVIDANHAVEEVFNLTAGNQAATPRRNYTVTNNVGDLRTSGTPLNFTNIDGLIIDGNTLPVACPRAGCDDLYWLRLRDAQNVQIGENDGGAGGVFQA